MGHSLFTNWNLCISSYAVRWGPSANWR